jgi:uncharacterized RDD family membrane protein YckC
MTDAASCPKCGFARDPAAAECPACGIVFARYDPERAGRRFQPGEGELYEPAAPPAAVDPYRAPAARLTGVRPAPPGSPVLARRFTRLAAAILDSLFFLPVVLIPLVFVAGDQDAAPNEVLAVGVLVAVVVGVLAIIGVNLYFLARDGQSLGKKALKIRIVRVNDERASLGRIVVLRIMAPGLIGAIPLVGPFFSLADSLLIFAEDRRCIHDHFADTKVVEA